MTRSGTSAVSASAALSLLKAHSRWRFKSKILDFVCSLEWEREKKKKKKPHSSSFPGRDERVWDSSSGLSSGLKPAFVFPVSKENAFFLDGCLTTRHFYVPHFIKLPNVIMLYADISSLSKTSNQLGKEEKRKKKKPCAGTHWWHSQAAGNQSLVE